MSQTEKGSYVKRFFNKIGGENNILSKKADVKQQVNHDVNLPDKGDATFLPVHTSAYPEKNIPTTITSPDPAAQTRWNSLQSLRGPRQKAAQHAHQYLIKSGNEKRNKELQKGAQDVWGVFGNQTPEHYLSIKYDYSYSATFRRLFPRRKTTLESVIRANPIGKRRTLELMGSNYILDPIATPEDPGFFVMLTDPRLPDEIIADSIRGIFGVAGNVADEITFESLRYSMASHGVTAFDFIVCRPYGPFYDRAFREKRGFRAVFLNMLLNYAQLLSKDGQLFTQIPEGMLGNRPKQIRRSKERLITLLKTYGYDTQITLGNKEQAAEFPALRLTRL
ncbi:hypothetical protein C4579_00015 [Candidatus Microgenomates bacterium]|nr:MAG: hypothetical protein C4579_00015 [Candidatus Microgenomates bacterium]